MATTPNATTTPVHLIAWAKGPNDRRNEASMVVRYTYAGTKPPADAARELDRGSIPAGATSDYPHDGYQIARGHGVTVRYANGRLRTFRG